MKKRIFLLLPLLWLAACDSSGPNHADETPQRGEIHQVQDKGSSPASLIANALTLAGVDDFWALTYDVEMKKIVYWTETAAGEAVLASAAFMKPVCDRPLPLLSIQHGTEIRRSAVASEGAFLSLEGAWGMAAASRGYAVVVPDYLGLGVSEQIHPYHLAEPTAHAVIDAVRAARQYCEEANIQRDGRLFLTGYSEGGYATLAAHRAMQLEHGDEFTVTASAPMAGAYDMRQTARYLVAQDDYTAPPYVALMLTAYNQHYGWNRLSDIFMPTYDAQVEALLDGTHGYSEVKAALPKRLDQLLTPALRQAVADSSDAEIEAALAENTLLDWSPLCPMRLYHGLADVTVPSFNSSAALAAFLAGGAADVQFIPFDGLSHTTAALPAVTAGMNWFESFWPES